MTMTSNDQILAFLKANQEALENDKEDDKKTRAKERQEDRDNIVRIIKLGVQQEVKKAVTGLELRLEEQEMINQKLSQDLNMMVREMEILREKVKNEPLPALPRVTLDQSTNVQVQGVVRMSSDNSSISRAEEDPEPQPDVPAVKRTLGFQCIYPKDVERQYRINGAMSEAEARLLSFKEFSKFEMKVNSEVFDKMKIEKIFPPAKNNWDTLYVQFASMSSLKTFYNHSRHLRRGQRLVPYISKEFYPRFRELQSIAYNLRHSDIKYKTRVNFENNKLVLFKKNPSQGTWTVVRTSPAVAADLQTQIRDPVQLNLRPQSAFSFSSKSVKK